MNDDAGFDNSFGAYGGIRQPLSGMANPRTGMDVSGDGSSVLVAQSRVAVTVVRLSDGGRPDVQSQVMASVRGR